MDKQKLAKRLFETINNYFPYDIDSDYDVQSVLNDIENSPEYIINSLLDIIDDLEKDL